MFLYRKINMYDISCVHNVHCRQSSVAIGNLGPRQTWSSQKQICSMDIMTIVIIIMITIIILTIIVIISNSILHDHQESWKGKVGEFWSAKEKLSGEENWGFFCRKLLCLDKGEREWRRKAKKMTKDEKGARRRKWVDSEKERGEGKLDHIAIRSGLW